MEDDIINLTQLENLPDPILLQILETMDPRSLINVCDQSKRIQEFCEYMWERFFKRDVTSTKWCKGPVDWGKFYKIAMDYIPVYNVNIKMPNISRNDYLESGYRDYNENYTFIGLTNTKANVMGLIHELKNKFEENYNDKKREKTEQNLMDIFKYLKPESKWFERTFRIQKYSTGELTINKIGKGILIRDILTQPLPLEYRSLIYVAYDIATTKSEYKKGKLVNQEMERSKNVLLDKKEILWRLKRILIDEHNFSNDEAEKFISMNKRKILTSHVINETFDTAPRGNFRKSFHVRITHVKKDSVDKATIERFLLGICDVVNKKD